ncbi:MerR family transcriptional regulator [Streptomyces sp. NPDC012888]|uniref:MerR family transcriptional regulator n=1 Tax=Streptomyces sp. NPDC012888 TaxID=3364855 RepID=UPI00367BC49E
MTRHQAACGYRAARLPRQDAAAGEAETDGNGNGNGNGEGNTDGNGDRGTRAGVTTGTLARELGISPTTLRSWDRRYGLGPAARIEGRHRRWTAEDVAMVHEMCRLTAEGVPPAEAARAAKARAVDAPPVTARPTVPRPTRTHPAEPGPQATAPPTTAPPTTAPPLAAPRGPSPLADFRRRGRGLARAAVRMDAEAVQERVTAAIDTYGLVAAWDGVLMPTLRYVGRKWETAEDRFVEVEHLLSWHISSALRHVYAGSVAVGRPTAEPRPVLLACLPGEQHTLPLEALTAVLTGHGLRVLMLGASVPAEALEATVRRTAPAAVALWSQARSTADLPLARHLAAARWGIQGARTRSRVLACGPGWGPRPDPELLRPLALGEAVRMMLSASRPGDDAAPASMEHAQEPPG